MAEKQSDSIKSDITIPFPQKEQICNSAFQRMHAVKFKEEAKVRFSIKYQVLCGEKSIYLFHFCATVNKFYCTSSAVLLAAKKTLRAESHRLLGSSLNSVFHHAKQLLAPLNYVAESGTFRSSKISTINNA